MVNQFQLSRLPVLYFGAGKIATLPAVIKELGGKALLITGRSSFIESGRYGLLEKHLKENGLHFFHETAGEEPSPGMVDGICRNHEAHKINVVVSIGGGSVMDTGKAVAAMLPLGEPVAEYLEGIGNRQHNGNKISFVAIPTTAGTGSEATKNSVLGEAGMEGFKRSLRHDNFVPDVAIVDPELTLSCPAAHTAAAGMDAFTQLVESYTSTKSNLFTDSLAWKGITCIKSSILKAYHHGNDLDARTDMAFAAFVSGITLSYAGLGAIHGFASSIGARFNIPHGVICGRMMAEVNKLNIVRLISESPDSDATRKYISLSRFFTGDYVSADESVLQDFSVYLENLTQELGLKDRFPQCFTDEDIEAIASSTQLKNNPVVLSPTDLAGILHKVNRVIL